MRGSWLTSTVFVSMLTLHANASAILTPSNVSQYQNPSNVSPIEVGLPDGASSMKPFAHILPLYTSGWQNLKAWGLSDPLFHATAGNSMSITGTSIAYMSCDASAYPGNIGVTDVFNTALAVNATAVLLYSLTAQYCNISGLESSYPYIYTMTDSAAARELLNRIDSAPSSLALHGYIAFADQISTNSSTSNTNGQVSTQTSSSSLGGSPTTAVAMIILYSITGIITALFLVIIVTGAVRAHRHPERYGPRSVIGRPRQSRARGLARAMLDTIPIVKFGEAREPPKQTDVELADGASGVTAEVEHTAVNVGRKSHDQRTDNLDATAPGQPRVSIMSARSGIAGDTISNHNHDDDTPGCSICTENFELGEDLRVLPCDHQFHIACIDPWLLNVSATCPLCRIDLNPARSGSTVEEENNELPPPIDTGDATARPRIGMRQSFLIGLGLGRVHDTTREDRIAAVRAMRAQLAATREREAAEREAAAAEPSRRRRFQQRFGIRTRRTGQEDLVRRTEEPGPEPDATADAERRET